MLCLGLRGVSPRSLASTHSLKAQRLGQLMTLKCQQASLYVSRGMRWRHVQGSNPSSATQSAG